MARPQVPFSRTAPLELLQDPEACDLDQLADYCKGLQEPLAVDLFSGAGGLSLGLEDAGFRVVLGVDRDPEAAATHGAWFGGASVCGDLSEPDLLEEIARALDGVEISLIAGGPPCQPFSRAAVNKVRALVNDGKRDPVDDRRELSFAFVRAVELLRPRAVLMENVPDFVLGQNSRLFRRVVVSLEGLGYDVYARVLSAWQYGVPQHRQRLFVVGIRDGHAFSWPDSNRDDPPTVREAISDLPPLEGGETEREIAYRRPQDGTKLSWLQRELRRGMDRVGGRGKLYDHVARAVREDDLEAFRQMDHETRYSDLPAELRRYRSDIFTDKYKRLPWDNLSRSITAHLAKDGYWYIHPEQHRTLSVREAARLQTFPDWFQFSGSRSNAYRQIGEAVPPLLARAMAASVREAIDGGPRTTALPRTSDVSRKLARWFEKEPESELRFPWRRERDPWKLGLGLLLFERLDPGVARKLWPQYRERRWPDPETFLRDEHREIALRSLKREQALDALTTLASGLSDQDPERAAMALEPRERSLAAALNDNTDGVHVERAVARVAERVRGLDHQKSLVVGQLVVGRLVGEEDGVALAAAAEVGTRFCKVDDRLCGICPLEKDCVTAANDPSPPVLL